MASLSSLSNLISSNQGKLKTACAVLAGLLLLKKLLRSSRLQHSVAQLPSTVPPALKRTTFVNSRGIWIHTRFWRASTKVPRAVVFLVHGYSEHSGRYDCLASMLNDLGAHVFSFDHQGHGQSFGDRAHVAHFSDCLCLRAPSHPTSHRSNLSDVDDTFAAVEFCRQNRPECFEGIPMFLYGHSMGGLVALHTLLRNALPWRGAILSSPALIPEESPLTSGPVRTLVSLLASMLPKLTLHALPKASLTHCPTIPIVYANDALQYNGGMRLRWATQMLDAMDSARAQLHKLTTPLLVLHVSSGLSFNILSSSMVGITQGNADYICRNSIECISAGATNVHDRTFKLFEDGRHELIHDPQHHDMYLSTIFQWIRDRSVVLDAV